MWSRRVERINELLLQEISRFVTERQHPDMGFVTFTGVSVTEDLMEAKVFFSVLGTDEERDKTQATLYKLKHAMRRGMRRLESLRRIPDLHFIHDGTPARAARVFELIEQIHHEGTSSPDAPHGTEAAAPRLPIPSETPEEAETPPAPKPTPKPRSRKGTKPPHETKRRPKAR
jgi:ribosome-binding factor A